MRHIIVQPSIDYYTWQIEVLINNLIEIGVNPNYIDVVCDNQKKMVTGTRWLTIIIMLGFSSMMIQEKNQNIFHQ